jgi:UDP:flavonoid glycosyltransferase YjiC (YdhE family)
VRVALVVSGHGFGHAVRSAVVARELLNRGTDVVVRSDAPEWLFPMAATRLPSPGWPIDVGVAQRDGLELDIDETRRRWDAFGEAFERRAATEAELLLDANVDVVLGDVPPLGFAAAALAGIPSAAMTNFTWDWIYAAWHGFEEPIACIRAAYRQADVLLRLPMHSTDPEAFSPFRRIEDVPLVARQATESRSAVRRRLGLPADATVVMLSFGGFDTARLDVSALGAWRRYLFVVTSGPGTTAPPTNVRVVGQQLDYAALVGACDAVVTKPGYGIVADCLVNRVPILYTDRGPFREYDVRVAALERLGHARYIPSEDVRRGYLGPALDDLLALPAVWVPPRTDGAAVVVDRLGQLVQHAPSSAVGAAE